MARSYAQWGNDLYSGATSYDIVGRRRMWFWIFGAVAILCLALVGIRGLNPGIEFRGGSQFVLQGVTTTEQQPAIDAVADVLPGELARVSSVGGDALRVQTPPLGEGTVSDDVRAALAAT